MPAVALRGVLDDGQSKAGPARFPRATLVHPIKALTQTRQMMRFNTRPIITDGVHRCAVLVAIPGDRDCRACMRVFGGIAQKVQTRAVDFVFRAQQRQ